MTKKVVRKEKNVKRVQRRRINVKVDKSMPSTKLLTTESDIHTLCHLKFIDQLNLDVMPFSHVIMENEEIDMLYSSENRAFVCKVISEKHTWAVTTEGPVEKCVWTDEKGRQFYLCTDLLKQQRVCEKVVSEKQEAIIEPVIILMRGSIQNAEKVVSYLKGQGIHLVRYGTEVFDSLPDLSVLLQDNFDSFEDFIARLNQEEQAAPHRTKQVTKTSHKVSKKTKVEGIKLWNVLATLGPIGYFPKGSGTLGALVALPLAYWLSGFSPSCLWSVTCLILALGLVAIYKFTRNKKEKDPSCVIIDEVVGQLITFWVVIPDFMQWPMLYAGFALFRFFDIFKFGPVAFWDRRKSPVGVMMDDVMAGVFAGFILAMIQVAMIEFFGF